MMKPIQTGDFEDTETAFRYKSDHAVRKAHFIFSVVNHPWVSAIATGAVKLALKLRLPAEPIIKSTVFELFCGGESIEETDAVINNLGKYKVHTILDYSVEGEASEAGFDHVMRETILTIEKGATTSFIPFSVFKVTGLASGDLLEKIHAKSLLSDDELAAYERVKYRVDAICKRAYDLNVPVLIDAEETWIQDPIDQIAHEMMRRYNGDKAIVFNTYQIYRRQGLESLKTARQIAVKGYWLGAKVVRGAYMEKERARAEAMGYESPIHPDKASTDLAFNESLEFCIGNIQKLSVMCGSHNEESNRYLTSLMESNGLPPSDNRVWFAQLYGMSDNISFGLASRGYNVAKYVPYGPVRSVMPYLLRRAAENTSVAGQSSRELVLIRKELRRRGRA